MSQLAAIIDRYYRGLPAQLRRGYALPPWPRRQGELSGLIPEAMWCGRPDPMGLVDWKPTGPTPEAGWSVRPYRGAMPPLFLEFMDQFRLPRITLRHPSGLLRLPSTPAHDPYADLTRLVSRWVVLLTGANQLAVAESDDGAMVALADRQALHPDGDGEVALYPASALSRVVTELLASSESQDRGCERVKALGRPLFRSMAELFDALADQSWPEQPVDPNLRPQISPPARYPWGSLSQVGDRGLPTPALPHEEEVADIDRHCARIRGKIDHLRSQDPGFLFAGSEYHRYRSGPRLAPDHIATFEAREGCRLPLAYARYLQVVGDGGMGPWRGLWPMDDSSAMWQAFRRVTDSVDEGRLARRFPYREHWNPSLGPKKKSHSASYYHPKHTQGAQILAEDWDDQGRRIIALLVLNGPEAGHVWSDHRHRDFGIKPVIQAGATSFLQWQEDGIDAGIALIDSLYVRLAQAAAAIR